MNFPKRLRNSLLWIAILSAVLMTAGDLVGLLVPSRLTAEQYPYWFTFMEYAAFISMWISVIIAISAFRGNRYILGDILPNGKGNTVGYLLIGLLGGLVMNGICALSAIWNGNIQLSFGKFELLPLLGLAIAVFIQSSAEEVLCRGFMYERLLESRSRYWIAILGNSLFFGIAHIFNDGMSFLGFYDLVIAGILYSLVVFYFDSLWMAMGLHATWNFTQSILLGLPNSGASFPYSVFHLDPGSIGGFSYDVAFGLEGTVLSSVMMTLCCIALYLWKNREKSIWGGPSSSEER